ncbi:hypothetical protein [Rhizobium phage RHph_X2_28B]|uniref:hypothetical protein n=1 Tax=Rhizobium phage RHph_X2_28B TaxID=2836086 RepID=UPI00232972A7|nr:hypothetical protein PP751_gp018 [Rhizobium phage RHph_X2_28B]QWY83470.1 hypothetical protein [Rhizobium phage RHph_X2_28B]QWY83706.1 hypothetical protein [Rhizobium phage RHph_X3_15]
MRGNSRPQMKPWVIGDDIEMGIVNRTTLATEWFPAIVIKLFPFTVQYPDGTNYEWKPNDFRRRPEKKLEDEPVKKELPAEVLKELYHKALVEIIKEGSTSTPNATVRRILNIAKEAIGEVQI